MVKILFVDVDGTLTETLSGHTFKQHPRDVKIIEGADRAIAHFACLEWTIIGVSNQGGVSAGFEASK
jgi:D-glycero-D-manno-heptose 1,7-bisphosphate phosphatase